MPMGLPITLAMARTVAQPVVCLVSASLLHPIACATSLPHCPAALHVLPHCPACHCPAAPRLVRRSTPLSHALPCPTRIGDPPPSGPPPPTPTRDQAQLRATRRCNARPTPARYRQQHCAPSPPSPCRGFRRRGGEGMREWQRQPPPPPVCPSFHCRWGKVGGGGGGCWGGRCDQPAAIRALPRLTHGCCYGGEVAGTGGE
ncbi:unnamed protein product [Closterium sp. NIES-53]